jgi:hypothetical protein
MTHSLLAPLLAASASYDGGEPGDALAKASRSFLTDGLGDIDLVREASVAAATLPPHGASWVALMIGNLVERGEGAAASFDGLWQLFLGWYAPLLDETPEGGERRAVHEAALPRLCQSLVAHLARLPDRRDALFADAQVHEALEGLAGQHVGAFWVCEAIERSSSDLILLHPTSRTGWRTRYDNVALCFHLFSLLQTSVGTRISGGREPDRALAEVARGAAHDQAMSDEAWWHYGNPRVPASNAMAMIPGDMLTRHIPLVDGVQVLLLWPTILSRRGWDSGFFGAHLQALPAGFAVTEALAPEECERWFTRLGVAGPVAAAQSPAVKRPWWKFW